MTSLLKSGVAIAVPAIKIFLLLQKDHTEFNIKCILILTNVWEVGNGYPQDYEDGLESFRLSC